MWRATSCRSTVCDIRAQQSRPFNSNNKAKTGGNDTHKGRERERERKTTERAQMR